MLDETSLDTILAEAKFNQGGITIQDTLDEYGDGDQLIELLLEHHAYMEPGDRGSYPVLEDVDYWIAFPQTAIDEVCGQPFNIEFGADQLDGHDYKGTVVISSANEMDDKTHYWCAKPTDAKMVETDKGPMVAICFSVSENSPF